jgi:hypothetical protein
MPDRIGQRLDAAGDSAFSNNPGGRIVNKVGNGVYAVARTMGMAIATKEVGEEAYNVAKDLVTKNTEPTTWAGKMGHAALGGTGEAIALIGLTLATWNCAADTVLSAYRGYQQVRAS